jgi:branched-chain amino acid transport system permease protein
MISSYWSQVLSLAGVNALGAWSLSIAIRSGQLSAGQAGFAGVAGYVAGAASRDFDAPLAVSLLVGFVVGVGLGAVIRLVFLRMAHLLFAVATMAFGEMTAYAMANIDQTRFGGAAGMGGIPRTASLTIVTVIVAAAVVAEVGILRRTAFDLRGRLGADDDLLVGLGGHSPGWLKVMTFGLSTGVAGLSGALFVHVVGFIQPPDLQAARSFDLLVFAVVGGVFSGYGSMLGAIGLTIAPEIVPYAEDNRLLFYGGALLVVSLIRPQGIFGRRPLPVLEILLGRSQAKQVLAEERQMTSAVDARAHPGQSVELETASNPSKPP